VEENSVRLGMANDRATPSASTSRAYRERIFRSSPNRNLGDDFQALMSGLCSVDHDDSAVVRRKLRMHRSRAFFEPKYPPAGRKS